MPLLSKLENIGLDPHIITWIHNYIAERQQRISRKKKCSISAPSFFLNGCPLEEVPTFKYLGIIISSDLSWSQHIERICSKARKIIGMLYRCYYQYADSSTLLKLYTSLVQPHVEYAAPVWDPSTVQDIQHLESVQNFALRVSSKQWDLGYSELLDTCNLPTLENQRLYMKLCHLLKLRMDYAIFHQA